ncbi:glycerol kinase [Rhodobacterales bacterium HTCC2150]|nr:glycerol kinase [Rhodobacterales bacterium HTCC2150] [Rhodobacteraceae bacterium HTCC2150]
MTYIMAIDQGTTSTRAILFDENMRIAHSDQQEFDQIFPQSGWVEHDVEQIWATIKSTCEGVLKIANAKAKDVAAIGITNQRETTVIWDKTTGKAIHNAIVWQDRRTAAVCEELRTEGHEALITHKTGLLLDPYFSGTKVKWLLDTVPGARAKAEAGELLFGTIDSFMMWRMTGGRVHATDATNAARTLLYNIRDGHWDADICKILDIPMTMLPDVRDCDAHFGDTDILGGSTPILAVAGDQQAATIGQACFEVGMMKSTYGTGCFALLNTGDKLIESQNKLLGTIAYQFGGKVTYALEGSIFVAGAAVQWLRDGMGIITDAAETGELAANADPTQDVILVPAFTGLGAPYWNAESRGAVFGMTRNTGPAELARAALESVGYQTYDLIRAMRADGDEKLGSVLRVDGGMTASNWSMQFLADILNARVDRPTILETTALGVAWVAGSKAGIYPDQAEFAANWALDQSFEPTMDPETRIQKLAHWERAIAGTQVF